MNISGVRALVVLYGLVASVGAQVPSKVWVADEGNGKYRNPVLFADYSDPDVIRVGDDFYLVASSFDQVPGLPILHSRDLVNWSLISHALPVQPPAEVYRKTSHGNGVWAPAIRFHKGTYYIYYPDPEYGIYVTTAKEIVGPWSEPKLIKAAKGWIDPCPLWDDDGKAYLVNGMAASRSGVKNVLILSRMAEDGLSLLDEGTLIVDGHGTDGTLEGPKIYKRDGFYYVFAPAGGVVPGYQLVFRSRSIYGPYERRKVLAQGTTGINGPHQGAWVDTAGGEDWFIHFQDRGAYGRVTLLEPMKWVDGWPAIGVRQDANGLGEPVEEYRKPAVAKVAVATPVDSDEFDGAALGLQWQWQANPEAGWALPFPAAGVLRLEGVPGTERLWDTPNVLSTKLPGPRFAATVKMEVNGLRVGDRTGVVMLGRDYGYVGLRQTADGAMLIYGNCKNADKGSEEKETVVGPWVGKELYVRAEMDRGGIVRFSTSADGQKFSGLGEPFTAREGVWIGAKLGLFVQSKEEKGERGYVDVDWVRLKA